MRLDLHDVPSVARRLGEWAAAAAGPESTVTGVTALPGHSAHSFAFTLIGPTDGRFVLRVSRPGARPGGTEDATRVVGLLQTLAGTDVPVPRLRWWSRNAADEAWFGASYTVVDLVEGATLPDLFAVPAPAPPDELDVAAVFADAVATLAGLHALGVSDGWGRPRSLRSMVESSTRPLACAPQPGWQSRGLEVRDALLATMPAEAAVVLVHNDFYSNNWIVGPDRLRAVLDWETSVAGQRGVDVGWLCMMYDPASWGPVRRAGMGWQPDPEELLEQYRTVSGDPLPDIGWYRALAGYRLACGTAHYLRLHRDGERHDPAWEVFGDSFETLLDRAVELLSCRPGPSRI